MYEITSRALRDIIPGALFSPGEFSGGLVPGKHGPSFDYLRFAADQAKNPTATFDYIANSSHCIARMDGDKVGGGGDPRARVAGTVHSIDNLRAAWPALENDPVYIFQFGVLYCEVPDPTHPGQTIATDEPGGRGAAWTFDAVLGFRESERHLAGIWHWSTGDDIQSWHPNGAFILHSNGWLYDIFDHFRGGSAWSMPHAGGCAGPAGQGALCLQGWPGLSAHFQLQPGPPEVGGPSP